ncbi:MAG: hypothetical protein ACRDRT_02110 [Pseudonocardiaceae bacterium]
MRHEGPANASTPTTSRACSTAECAAGGSIQHSKGRYTYFFGLGQKNDPARTCREPYVALAARRRPPPTSRTPCAQPSTQWPPVELGDGVATTVLAGDERPT